MFDHMDSCREQPRVGWPFTPRFHIVNVEGVDPDECHSVVDEVLRSAFGKKWCAVRIVRSAEQSTPTGIEKNRFPLNLTSSKSFRLDASHRYIPKLEYFGGLVNKRLQIESGKI